jgi:hypothetical protein
MICGNRSDDERFDFESSEDEFVPWSSSEDSEEER